MAIEIRTTISSVLVCIVSLLFQYACAVSSEIYGFRVEPAVSTDESTSAGFNVRNGSTVILANEPVELRLYGRGFSMGTVVSFTTKVSNRGEDCSDMRSTDVVDLQIVTSYVAIVLIELPVAAKESEPAYYICLKEPSVSNKLSESAQFIHQGSDHWLRLFTEPKPVRTTLLPLWLQITVIVVLLCFSGLFSGLNLGLMSLDQTELSILENSGTPREKRYAKTIRPVRKRGNFLLCTILLGNVLVNNTLAILLDDLTGSGFAAIIGATLAIVVFGEIVPQAICSRYGLAVGARTIWFTKFFMMVTFPLSFPISRILDCILGEEIGYVFNRDRLRELLRITENQMDLKKDEVNIIAGALELSKKTVGTVMTKIEDVFMIEYNSVLDFDTMSQIMKNGYTRIPVFENERTNIVALLNIKDLAFVDPDDRTPLKTVCKFYNHPVNFIFEDTRLDIMLEEFKKGKSHMAVVQTINDKGPGDPFYETVGLVTLEDVIEEIIQSEIIDETDIVTDNRVRAPRKMHVKDFSVFNQPDHHNYPRLSPQLALATFQYLSTTVVPFKSDLISESVLQRLLRQNILMNFRLVDQSSPDCFLYRNGKPCDFFIMILQGRVHVEFGKECLVFEGGPFVYFGIQALVIPPSLLKQTSVTSMNSLSDTISLCHHTSSAPYVPDFTVRALSDLQYMRIRRVQYVAALRASILERRHRQQGMSDGSGLAGTAAGLSSMQAEDDEDTFTKEWQRAQSAIASSPMDGTRSDTGSIPDDSSAREVTAISQPSFDEPISIRTDVASEVSPGFQEQQSNSFNMNVTGEAVEMPLLQSANSKK